MSTKRYSPEFKDEAVRQVVDRGYSVAEVSDRLGVSSLSLYKMGQGGQTQQNRSACDRARRDQERNTQTARPTPTRGGGTRYLKKSGAVLCQGARVKYRFINEHRHRHGVAPLCRMLDVARSGFYAWVHNPLSDRAIEDQRLLKLIRHSYQASGNIYGSPRIFLDLREVGERCGKHRVARLMRTHKIKAVLSGSLNFIFNNYNDSNTFAEIVKLAGDEGYTEPDPLIDLSGVDVMRKILILSREAGHKLEMSDVTARPFLPESCLNAASYDIIVSNQLVGNYTCQLAENERLKLLFDEILQPEGSEFYMRDVKDYIKLNEDINFYTLSKVANEKSEIAIGYRIKSEGKLQHHGIYINPPKTALIKFSLGDQIIVLAES